MGDNMAKNNFLVEHKLQYQQEWHIQKLLITSVTQLVGSILLETFWGYTRGFWILQKESWLLYRNNFPWITQSNFLTGTIQKNRTSHFYMFSKKFFKKVQSIRLQNITALLYDPVNSCKVLQHIVCKDLQGTFYSCFIYGFVFQIVIDKTL